MLRVVLDINVFISGIISSGAPSKVIEAWKDGKFELLVSESIIKEIIQVIYRPRIKRSYQLPTKIIQDLVS